MQRAIDPRPLRLHLDGTTPRHWLGGDGVSTQLFNALSLVFPRGEQMFVDAVRAHRDAVRDPELKQAVRDFIGQEVNHGRAHVEMNEWLASLGLPVADIDREVAARIAQRKRLSPRQLLAITCALEHFTAILAAAMLSHPDLIADMHEDVRPLWLWHAIEEIEHKSVAFDVYAESGASYERRVITMALVTVMFLTRVTMRHRRLMRADDLLGDRAARRRAMRRFFGPSGVLASALPSYLAYYRRTFHPDDIDDAERLVWGKERLAALLAASKSTLRSVA